MGRRSRQSGGIWRKLSLLLPWPVTAAIVFLAVPEELQPLGSHVATGLSFCLSLFVLAADLVGVLSACPTLFLCSGLLLTQLCLALLIHSLALQRHDHDHLVPMPVRLQADAVVAAATTLVVQEASTLAVKVTSVRKPKTLAVKRSSATTKAATKAAAKKAAATSPKAVKVETDAAAASQNAEAEPLPVPPKLSMDTATISVILACAGEGSYGVKTALKVVERTPEKMLQEVIVVDDGSDETMEHAFEQAGVLAEERQRKKIVIIRHPETLGLMVAKKTGGDAAKGDILAFFDCHVSTQPNWYKELSKLIIENPKRMVVPAITDLDLDSWEERKDSQVNTKCYLTWRADFDWFDDDSPYVPIMSGGLLATSAYWWNLTGGYDRNMRGWGGENLDQSLRSWLCGGEIMRAPTSRVAHMWRTGDARTRAHYRLVGSAEVNKQRVVVAWYGEFAQLYGPGLNAAAGGPLDVAGIKRVQERLGCKPFVNFLYRFRDIYVDGAVIPQKVFQLREKGTGKCLRRGFGTVSVGACSLGTFAGTDKALLFHWANRIKGKSEKRCCSGLRLWGSDQCLDWVDDAGIHLYLCDVVGGNGNQQYHFKKDGRVSHKDGRCLASKGQTTALVQCAALEVTKGLGVWEEIEPFEPIETQIYKTALKKEGLPPPDFP